VTEKRDVVLKHHVGSPNNTPGSTPSNTSDGCYAGPDDGYAGSGDAAGAVDTGGHNRRQHLPQVSRQPWLRENAVMPSAASRSERIIFSFVQLLAGGFSKE